MFNGTKTELTPAATRPFSVQGYDTYLSYTGPRLLNAVTFATAQSELEDAGERFENVQVFCTQDWRNSGGGFLGTE